MSSAKSWFVQTEFGATLGPMPDDALQELVRTGAIVRSDQVRSELEGEWRRAAEIPGLFDVPASAPPSGESASRTDVVASPAAVPPIATKVSLTPPRPPVIPPTESPLIASATQFIAVSEVHCAVPPAIDEVSAPVSAPPEDELISNWKSERSRLKEDLGMVSLASEMTQADDGEVSPPELPANLLDEPPEPVVVAVTPAKSSSRPEIHRASFLDQIKGLEDGRRKAVESSQEKWIRWQRSLPSWPIVAVIAMTLIATWWYWPRSHRGFYGRYVAIWEEWKTRRTDFKDTAGWDRFLKHTESELNDIVPWLQANTRAGDREKQLLLWIGRDCLRKMLKNPRHVGTAEETQLLVLMTNARDFYASSQSGQPNGGIDTATKTADPEHGTGGGIIDPNVVQQGMRAKSSVPATTPAQSDASPNKVPEAR